MRKLQKTCYRVAKEKGFWDTERNNGELISLMHSELSEALEELRKPQIDWMAIGEELADCVIRILDFCEARNIDLEKAIIAKIGVNKNRPYKHNKRFQEIDMIKIILTFVQPLAINYLWDLLFNIKTMESGNY